MNHYYTFLALDIARERERDAALQRRAELAGRDRIQRPSVVRRGLANALALVSRGSTAAVRRLDDCVAEDLNQALAAGR